MMMKYIYWLVQNETSGTQCDRECAFTFFIIVIGIRVTAVGSLDVADIGQVGAARGENAENQRWAHNSAA